MENTVVIYSKTNCPYCVMAKKWFDNKKIAYTENVLDSDEERRHFYASCNEDGSCSVNHETIKTVPQIFVNNVRIGGYSELIKNESYVYHLLGMLSEEE